MSNDSMILVETNGITVGEKLSTWVAVIVKEDDGADFSTGPVGGLFDALVLGKVEGQNRDPGTYAQIMQTASKTPGISDWKYFAFQVQKINGLRRCDGANIKALTNELQDLLADAGKKIENGQAKYILLAEAYYNLGIMQRGPKLYELAAQSQRFSLGWYALSGCPDKMYTGLFVSLVEDLTEAFCQMNHGLIFQRLSALTRCRDFILEATGSEYPQWMKWNACLHIGWAAAMAELIGVKIDLRNYNIDFIAGEQHGNMQWATLFLAISYYREESWRDILKVKLSELPGSSKNNVTLSLEILKAVAHKKLGQDSDADQLLQAVANYSGSDGGLPIAVAQALLEK